MNIKAVIAQLQALGAEKVSKQYSKAGAEPAHVLGVKLGDIRKLAKTLKTNHPLALSLWASGYVEAQFLAILLLDTQQLTEADLRQLTHQITFAHVADWWVAYVLKGHPASEALRTDWMQATDKWPARIAWSLTAEQIAKGALGLDLPALLDRIENEMPFAPTEVQWTMNTALAYIGIYHPALRARALAIGDRLGVFKDYPVSKGCTSPYAPIWINEMVRRQG